MHQESIINSLLKKLNLTNIEVYKITLSVSKEALTQRFKKAIDNGERPSDDVLQRSIERLPLYIDMNTIPIDVSNISPIQAAKKIVELIGN